MKFIGIRYATAARLGKPIAAPDLPSANDAQCHKVACPQSLSRLTNVMGDTRHLVEENEDCLRLAIFTPAADNRKRRVLVFIHGGAFLTGSAVSECYDASTLAQSCDIVVVNISYRLGALGFLYSPEQGIVNLGMADQWCALQWIRRNIHLFGGDASRMTLMGQSAGGYSILYHIANQSDPLFSKAIILSSPYLSFNEKTMRSRTAEYLHYLGKSPQEASLVEILRAQQKLLAKHSLAMPFAPVSDSLINPRHIIPGLKALRLTCQQDDATPFAPRWLQPLATQLVFKQPMLRYARRMEKAGIDTQAHVLTWRHGEPPFGATHCMELPLIFGSWDTWKDTPFMHGVTQAEYHQQAEATKQWINDFL